MKQVYTNVIPLANASADRLAALEALCRSKVAEVLQAYLERRSRRVDPATTLRTR